MSESHHQRMDVEPLQKSQLDSISWQRAEAFGCSMKRAEGMPECLLFLAASISSAPSVVSLFSPFLLFLELKPECIRL